MQKSGYIPKHAEEDVNKRIGGTKACFYPDCAGVSWDFWADGGGFEDEGGKEGGGRKREWSKERRPYLQQGEIG